MDVKSGIGNFIIDSFHNAQEELLRKNTGRRIKSLHVSDFCSPCLRKAYYQRLYPIWEMNDQMRAVLYNGTIVHEHSQLAPFHEITMCYDVNKDLAYTPMEVMQMPEGERAGIVTGTVDDVMKYGDDYVICDKKTYNGKGFVKNSADEMHQLQINIYNVMLAETFDIKSKYGCVLYLDKSKDLKETPVVFELADKDEIKQYMRDTMEKLRGLTPPKGTICYLCNGENRNSQIYCNYVDQCERDGNRVDIRAAGIKIPK